MAVKVPQCPECYSDLDFNGKCPICNLRKNHGKKKMIRKSKKNKDSYDKYDKYRDYEEDDEY